LGSLSASPYLIPFFLAYAFTWVIQGDIYIL
jgi:hypothetical protein